MANDISIKVDSTGAVAAVQKFARSLQSRQRLLVELGMAMLVSIRRTFREQGSPPDSWAPIAASTRRSNPKIYGAGHKTLILSGRLLNSIGVQTEGENAVRIGTNLVYAAVQNYGSRDRGMGEGPQARLEGRDVEVGERSYYLRQRDLGTGTMRVARQRTYISTKGERVRSVTLIDESGKKRTVHMKIEGPRNATHVTVGAHRRFQNIPGRPYMVFRPEDPERLQQVAVNYVARCRREAELEGR